MPRKKGGKGGSDDPIIISGGGGSRKPRGKSGRRTTEDLTITIQNDGKDQKWERTAAADVFRHAHLNSDAVIIRLSADYVTDNVWHEAELPAGSQLTITYAGSPMSLTLDPESGKLQVTGAAWVNPKTLRLRGGTAGFESIQLGTSDLNPDDPAPTGLVRIAVDYR